MLRNVERRIARMKAPLAVKLQIAFLILIGVLLAAALVSLLAIAGIREQAVSLNSINQSVGAALGLDHSIVLQEHLSSMFLLTADESYSTKLITEQQRFRELVGELRAHGATAGGDRRDRGCLDPLRKRDRDGPDASPRRRRAAGPAHARRAGAHDRARDRRTSRRRSRPG